MITPAFPLTATERVLPSLTLDFTKGVLDPRITVARALNTATRVNSSGLVEIVNAGLPRFDYDPVTLSSKGLLIEEARANLFTYSEQLNNPAWSLQDVTIGADATTSPNGAVNADAVIPSTTNTQIHRVLIGTSVAAAPYSLSIYAKSSGYSWLKLRIGSLYANFNVSTGVAGIAGAGTTSSIANAGNGWYRCTITGTPAANAVVFIYPMTTNNADLDPVSYAGDGTSGIFMWGAQLEAGTFATSYIPTTTTSLTRNADLVTMTGTNFSSWYNQPQGAFAVEFIQNLTLKNGIRLLSVDNGSLTRVLDIYSYLGTNWFSWNGSTNIDAGAPYLSNNPQTIATAYKSGSYSLSANGGTVGTANSALLNTPTMLAIGSLGGGSFFNGYVRKILYWPQRITNNETQAFSK